jgi:prephenate dehydrogenase
MPKFKLPPRLPFKKLGVAGLGLIGGSVAKAFSPFDGLEISVFDVDPKTVAEAKLARLFKRAASDPEELMGFDLDFAYLSLPAHRNIQLIEKMSERGVGYAVTHSGSTKSATNEAALRAGISYCGGHPIAGKEVAGFSNSSADLIPGCLYILTPDPRFGPGQKELLGRLRAFHELIGCRIEILSPPEHDKLYSLVSHLPYLAASALAGTAMLSGGTEVLPFAGTGFRDTTRVGASPPLKWVEVTMENSTNLTDCLDALIEVLTNLKEAIAQKNEPELTKLLEEFSAFRRALPQK